MPRQGVDVYLNFLVAATFLNLDIVVQKLEELNSLAFESQHQAIKMAEPVVRTNSKAAMDDEAILASMGYKQELRRDWGLAHNFGISFSIIVSFPHLSIYFSIKITC